MVDVFTTEAFEGNGLAVVYGADRLKAHQMQSIAREFNLSETAFPVVNPLRSPSDQIDDDVESGEPDYQVRIFTPETELPFAGHPSIGSAWALCRRGLLGLGRLRQQCGAGRVGLEVKGLDETVWLTGRPPRVSGEIDPVAGLSAVGLSVADQVGITPVMAGAGLDFHYLFVRPGSIARAVPDLVRLRQMRSHGSDLGGVAIVGWHDGVARVRVFTDDIGATEDPATGSAALGLGAVLVSAGLLAEDGESTFTVRQGIEIGRPSVLHGRVEAKGGVPVRCSVGGTVVPVSTGRIAIPRRD